MDGTATFLIRSERKVIDHCRQILRRNGLSESEAQRMHALLETAEAELERLMNGGSTHG